MVKTRALASLLLVGCAVPEEPTVEPARHDVTALAATLEARGSVRVIAGVRVPSRAGAMQIAEATRVATERHARTATAIEAFATMPFVVLRVGDAAALAALAADPEITSLEPDLLVAPALSASTAIVGATTAWSHGHTGAGWAVAVLDTGVLAGHTHLAGKVVAEACYSTTDAANASTSLCPGGVASSIATGAATPCTGVSGCDHGTHVAAIAASGNAQYAGVAKGASIVAVQVFSRFESPALCGSSSPCVLAYSSDWARGMERVLALAGAGTKVAAVNLSLGGGEYAQSCDAMFPSMKAAIDTLAAAGIPTVIAAGNDGHSSAVAFPACISSGVTVGATTKADAIATYSNLAPQVDVLAPGSSIVAATSASTTSIGGKSGTSMAAPHVAGAFAVMRSARPALAVAQGVAALQATGTPITDGRGAMPVTKPRIAIAAAIASLSAPPPCARAAPAIDVTQPALVRTPQKVVFTARVTNHDSATCPPHAFDIGAGAPAGWTTSAARTTLAPGASTDVTIDITPPAASVASTTALAFTATNATMTAYAATATASYRLGCERAPPVLVVGADPDRTLVIHVQNQDPESCGAATTYRMAVSTALAVTPPASDVVVARDGEQTVEVGIATGAPAGTYAVRVTLSVDDELVADVSTTVTIESDGSSTPGDGGLRDLNLGCSATGGASGLWFVLALLALLALRRASRSLR